MKQHNKASGLGEADNRSRGPHANNEGEVAALGAVDASVLATLLNLLDAESFGTAPAAAGRRWGQRQEEARRLACRRRTEEAKPRTQGAVRGKERSGAARISGSLDQRRTQGCRTCSYCCQRLEAPLLLLPEAGRQQGAGTAGAWSPAR